MFIVHYKDGKSISESDMSWLDVPKEDITSIQLKWDMYDFVKVLRERLDQFSLLIDGGQQFKAKVEVETSDYLSLLHSANVNKNQVANSVLDKANEIVRIIEGKLISYKKEFSELNSLKSHLGLNEVDEKRFNYLLEAVRRSESHRSLLLNIIGDMRAFLDSDTKLATLVGSSKHKYAFWQDKVAYYNINSAKDLGPFTQRIGMVIDNVGRTIVCEMNLRTGNYKVYVTTLDSLRLNMQLFDYIKLEEVK